MKIFIQTSLVCIALLCTTHCNFFEPLVETEESNYDNLLIKGNEAFSAGEYESASQYYVEAQKADPARSEAWVFHAKAVMRLYGLEYSTINDEIKRKSDGEAGLPFINKCDASNLDCIDSIFHPIALTVRNLEYVTGGTDTASRGMIGEEVVVLDVALLQGMASMLNPLDLDNNLHIDTICGYDICGPDVSGCSNNPAGLVDYTTKCPYGAKSELKRYQSFRTLTEALNIDDLKSDAIEAKDISRNPNEINQFINDIALPAQSSRDNLEKVNTAINEHADDKSLGEQLSDVTEIIDNLVSFVQYYKSNDTLDNDFDYISENSPDSIMIWHDFDGDNAIRYDYTDSLTDISGITSFKSPMGSIGHPVHRYAHPDLYYTMEEYTAQLSAQTDSTTRYNRTNNMIDYCKSITRSLSGITNDLEDSIKDSTCTLISSTLKEGTTPPSQSDWIAGPFGIDEEILDNYDNDFDGIKNEDSRLAIGMDDDTDALFTIHTPHTVIAMEWSDNNGNKCIDIDTTITAPSSNPRQFCIGTLEHRLYLAENASDSLDIYYIPFDLSEHPDFQTECIADVLFFELSPLHSEETIALACTVGHHWALGQPESSEWTGGTFGIDEEKVDGIDNDGDGYIDEDVAAKEVN
ncbi:MAG: hypothetical protein OCD01_02030 [Fibrobacterales bacterium]